MATIPGWIDGDLWGTDKESRKPGRRPMDGGAEAVAIVWLGKPGAAPISPHVLLRKPALGDSI
jgi:hypothetical protein